MPKREQTQNKSQNTPTNYAEIKTINLRRIMQARKQIIQVIREKQAQIKYQTAIKPEQKTQKPNTKKTKGQEPIYKGIWITKEGERIKKGI